MQWRDALLRRFPRLEAVPADNYVVGGAIRDLLLGQDPADVDIASNDALAVANRIGPRVIRLGGNTGDDLSAYRVVEGGHVYDVAPLLDGDIVRDLGRRDFTVNALAVDLRTGELLDQHGGQKDLEARLVRMVRAENFDDDPLRMLKTVRMAVRHDFAVDGATIDAVQPRAAAILSVAAERVWYELSVIFEQRRFRTAIRLLRETGLDVPLFGRSIDASAYHEDDVSLKGSFALLVSDPRGFARRWRWGEAFLRQVVALQQLLAANDRVALYDAGEEVARQLPAVLRALGRGADARRVEGEMLGSLFATKPLLSGDEIAAATGLGSGPAIGQLKRGVLEAQIRGEIHTRDEALAMLRVRPQP